MHLENLVLLSIAALFFLGSFFQYRKTRHSIRRITKIMLLIVLAFSFLAMGSALLLLFIDN